jgi:hypothetical protein
MLWRLVRVMSEESDSYRRIPEFPDYAVTRDGRVKNIRLNHVLKVDHVWGKHASVKLRKDGNSHHRSVSGLQEAVFGDEM